MSKRLSDDEKRFYTDQISLLKGENERLTKIIEDLEADLTKCKKLAEKYIYEYEKFAFENGLHELKIENERLLNLLAVERGCEECWTGEICGYDCRMIDGPQE